MAIYAISKRIFKCGSTWDFWHRRTTGKPPVPIDLTGMTGRVMYRYGSVYGPVIKTVINANLTLGGLAGTIIWSIPAVETALFIPDATYFYDIELTLGAAVWHSPTFKIKTEKEVTHD